MIKKINENTVTPVTHTCDVLVCGGGFGGISAALSAARFGAEVILLEKEYILGGLGTAGLVTQYLPLCDGKGHQVSFGIAEELFRLSISMGTEAHYPDNWLDSNDQSKRTENDMRFQTRYNPSLFAILVEKLLTHEGVKILYGTYAVSANVENEKINAVIVENKSGRQAIVAGSVVDATGDCDIAVFAGAPTKIFDQGNILASWYYFLNEGKYDLKSLGAADIPDEHKTEQDRAETLGEKRFSGLDGDEISEFVHLSHSWLLDDIIKTRVSSPTLIPTTIPTIPQIRMTRRISGEYTLHDTQEHTYFEDSVGMVSNWRKRGPVYEIPFKILYSNKIKNLITAGRCVSVTDSMWDIMRVIPCCAVTGQAAGTAAAMTDNFSKINIKQLQKRLMDSGVVIHENKQ